MKRIIMTMIAMLPIIAMAQSKWENTAEPSCVHHGVIIRTEQWKFRHSSHYDLQDIGQDLL